MDAELEAALVLSALPGLGYSRLFALYRSAGSFRAILAAEPPLLPADCRPALADFRASPASHLAAARARRDAIAATDIEVLTLGDERYPALLREIARPPLLLYWRGSVAALALPQVAIVGSRQCTPAGAANAHEFARYLAANGFAITSGLAEGIDGAAHRGALATGVTIAVLGAGIDRIYPRQHTALAAEIVAAGGALVSEFAPGTPPRAENFPRRNRLISGLSLGVLVVEAAQRSGSLITARRALEQGREVFAVPGSIHNPLARGCHQLLREGATLVETAAHVVAELGGLLAFKCREAGADPVAGDPSVSFEGSEEELLVLGQLGYEATDLDALVARTGMVAAQLSRVLVGLELKGAVTSCNGVFTRIG